MRTLSMAVTGHGIKDGQNLKNAAHCTTNLEVLYETHRSRYTRERGVATEGQEALQSPPRHVPRRRV